DESARVAKVQALDDEVREAFRILPINAGAYRSGTFARLADAYAAAGEPQKAAEMRPLALQEPFLRAFAQAGSDRQQKLIDSLPPQDRAAAEAIKRDQSDTVAEDDSNPSLALNPDINSPFASEGIDSDTETGRLLDAIYGDDRLALATEPADGDAHGLLHHVQAVEDNKRQGIAAEDAEVARLKSIDRNARLERQIRIYIDGGPTYMVSDIILRGNGTAVMVIEIKSGFAELTTNQAKVLAEAIRSGRIYITNVEAAKKLGIEPNKTFGAQRILPEVYVLGGNTPKIERQLRNEGVDVRPTGVRGRVRITMPPS